VRPRILVNPGIDLTRRARLFLALGQWLDVEFVEDRQGGEEAVGEIYFARSAIDQPKTACSRFSQRLVFLPGIAPEKGPCIVRFSNSKETPPALRGLRCDEPTDTVLPPSFGGGVLAGGGAGSVWMRRLDGEGEVDFAASPPGEIPEGKYLFDQVQPGLWSGLFPLIDFLRRVGGSGGWGPPPLRACIMFDDPNLHWINYGFLNYAALADHADQYNYHAAIATVPLDAWGLNSRTAAIFRAMAPRLSLLVHGNNHTRAELAQSYSDREHEQLVAQSLKRIAGLERVFGTSIPRVMAAPHGACSEIMAGELLRQGYEAACISHGSLRKHNSHKEWPSFFGLEPAEFLAGGLPVIPRFRLTHGCLPQALLAAFLGQAVIPVGHHQDLADGLDLLEEVSAGINGIGKVKWCNMSRIARTNFKQRVRGSTLQLRMYARSIEIDVGEAIEAVQIERAWLPPDRAEPLEMRSRHGNWVPVQGNEIKFRHDHGNGRTIEIRSIFPATVDYRQIDSPSFQPWPIFRRILAETRDRFQPLFYSRPHSHFRLSDKNRRPTESGKLA
jgi:hypothetical protein